ncbi:MAG: nucleotidyltransferase family protein [Ignavibacteriaceae bacterium]
MKAMIFAAGKGTRLRPLTDATPKALIPYRGIPLIEHVITKLIQSGISQIVVNVHHFGNLIVDFLASKNNFGIDIQISDESDLLLETGGGLKKAFSLLDDSSPILLHNTDIISSVDLADMLAFHKRTGAIATTAVRTRQTGRYLLFDSAMRLCGWKNTKTGEVKPPELDASTLQNLAFSGIHIIEPGIQNYFPEEKVFSIIDLYISVLNKEKISGYLHDNTEWKDMGKIEDFEI